MALIDPAVKDRGTQAILNLTRILRQIERRDEEWGYSYIVLLLGLGWRHSGSLAVLTLEPVVTPKRDTHPGPFSFEPKFNPVRQTQQSCLSHFDLVATSGCFHYDAMNPGGKHKTSE